MYMFPKNYKFMYNHIESQLSEKGYHILKKDIYNWKERNMITKRFKMLDPNENIVEYTFYFNSSYNYLDKYTERLNMYN